MGGNKLGMVGCPTECHLGWSAGFWTGNLTARAWLADWLGWWGVGFVGVLGGGLVAL